MSNDRGDLYNVRIIFTEQRVIIVATILIQLIDSEMQI